MGPKKLIILDVYENGAYDLQQELRIAYGNEPGISVEIASITDSKAMERVFSKYHPQIVINAAAHKHVPLMENNCIESVIREKYIKCINFAACVSEQKKEAFIRIIKTAA